MVSVWGDVRDGLSELLSCLQAAIVDEDCRAGMGGWVVGRGALRALSVTWARGEGRTALCLFDLGPQPKDAVLQKRAALRQTGAANLTATLPPALGRAGSGLTGLLLI